MALAKAPYRVGMLRTYPVILVATLIAGVAAAQAYQAGMPDLRPQAASNADNACASIAAYALTHAKAKIMPCIKSCEENPNKAVCEETIELMKVADPAKERTYRLTCAGHP